MGTAISEEQILAVYRDTIDTLYGYVSRTCGGDRALAEDVTQETWLRAVREWRRKGAPERPISWLSTVARNLLANHFRRAMPVPLDHPAVSPQLDNLESEETRALVRQALDRLPVAQARLIEAFHYDRRRISEIAQTIGVSERAVEGRLRRARENLRAELMADMEFEGGNR